MTITKRLGLPCSATFFDDLMITPLSVTDPMPQGYLTFIRSIEKEIHHLIEKQQIGSQDYEKKLYQLLPIIDNTPIEPNTNTFSITILCQGENTEGIAHFIPHLICHWLVFGRTLNISSNRCLSFHFKNSSLPFTFLELIINIDNIQNTQMIEENLQSLIKEIRLSILAVYHARSSLSMQELSIGDKNNCLQQDLSFYLNQSSYDKTKEIIYNLQKEKKLSQIKKNIAFLLTKRPLSFDRDIFDHIYHVTQLYRGHFATHRDPKHLSRIIALQYFFQKTLKNQVSKKKILLKVLKTQKENTTVLGVILSFHFNADTQRFEKAHAIKAISTCIDNYEWIPDSFILDKREEKICSIYFEIQKNNFSKEEIMQLKNKLPNAIFSHTEPIVHNIFNPPNEEETIRNIILLSKQIKYVKDLPQVIINYDSQNSNEIQFQIIMVRILQVQTPSIKQLIDSSCIFCHIHLEEVKTIGLLRNKYIKEANLFRISINKASFFRPDNSLDLRKARSMVAAELTKVIGEFRDYNGGMIAKQHYVFRQAKKLLPFLTQSQEHFLANVFYSLKPTIMQSILPPSVLSSLFQMVLSALDADLSKSPYFLNTYIQDNYQVIFIASNNPKIKEEVYLTIRSLKYPSIDLGTLSIEVEDISITALLHHLRDNKQQEKLLTAVEENLKENFY